MTYLAVPPSPGRSAWRMRLFDLAEFHGWKAHLFGSDFEPDLICIRRPRILWLFAEPDRGRLSSARYAAFSELIACRQQAFVLHPSDEAKVMRLLE